MKIYRNDSVSQDAIRFQITVSSAEISRFSTADPSWGIPNDRWDNSEILDWLWQVADFEERQIAS